MSRSNILPGHFKKEGVVGMRSREGGTWHVWVEKPEDKVNFLNKHSSVFKVTLGGNTPFLDTSVHCIYLHLLPQVDLGSFPTMHFSQNSMKQLAY